MKQAMRKWLCKNISKIHVENKDIYYMKDLLNDERIGSTDKYISGLQKSNCKNFTETFLKAFDKNQMTLSYSIEKQNDKYELAELEDDDWFN